MRRLQLKLKSLLDSGRAAGLMARERLINGYDWSCGAICRIVNSIAFIAEKSLDLSGGRDWRKKERGRYSG